MIDINQRLVRFAGKVCLSTDTELEAADEISRLRSENKTAFMAVADVLKTNDDLKMKIACLRSALKPFAYAYTNEEFEYSPAIFKSSELRAAAEAIMDETE